MVRCAGGLPAFLAMPNREGKLPAIVLMHERYGLVKHTCDLAVRLARDGFVCIAPDFFYKHPDQDALHRGDVGYEMTDPEAVEYLSAAIAELAKLPQVDQAKIVVKGVCQTGRHPLVLAAERPIAAALVWYGAASQREWGTSARYPRPLDEIIAKAECPVQGIFDEADHVISLADVRKFRDALDRHDKTYRIKVYAGRRMAGSTTQCPAATGTRRRRQAGRCSWRSSTRCSRPATIAHAACRSTNASIRRTMISRRMCGWSNVRCRPRASGDPCSPVVRAGTMPRRGLWLWVPAFAGTTVFVGSKEIIGAPRWRATSRTTAGRTSSTPIPSRSIRPIGARFTSATIRRCWRSISTTRPIAAAT